FKRFDDVVRLGVQRNRVREAVRDYRPRQLLVAEVLRQLDREHPPLAAAQKMRRLPQVGPTRLDAVFRTGRNVEFLFQVPVEVANEQALAAVLVVIPALEGGCDTRAALANGLGQRQRTGRLADSLLSGAGQRAAGGTCRQQPETCESTSSHCCSVVARLI